MKHPEIIINGLQIKSLEKAFNCLTHFLQLMVKNVTGKMLQKTMAYHSMISASGLRSDKTVRWQ